MNVAKPPTLPEQPRCSLGYIPRADRPARRPYDCPYHCQSLDDCMGKKMEGYEKVNTVIKNKV